MKRSPAEEIVAFLSFSDTRGDCCVAIEKLTDREWNSVLRWMEDAGLAFFFLQRLMESNTTRIVPASVLSRLQHNFALNKTRTADLSRRFQSINRHFDDAGVRYAVMKGFSLVPEFCPSAALRHQADLDYLIEPQSIPAAQRILTGAGYRPRPSVSAKEFIFVSEGANPSRDDLQYSPGAGHAVELHTDVWDHEMLGLPRLPQFFGVDQARRRHWNDLAFLSLGDADAFLLQILHACHHLFTQWIRMSCLFEIGYFLDRRALDTDLWSAVAQRVQDDALVREFVVIVAELVGQLFAAPVPAIVQDWATRIHPATRVWIDNYARDWAFCELPVYQLSLFPRSKFVLFLRQQYREGSLGKGCNSNDLSKVDQPSRKQSMWLPSTDWWKRKHLFRRGIYYALAQARYLCEIPRWHWLNRATTSAPANIYLPVSKKVS